MIKEQARAFWNAFCQQNSKIDPDALFQVWFFGNTREMARDLGELVVSGIKTATASSVAMEAIEPENIATIDGYSIVTDFDGVPLCVIQTTEIRTLAFNEVDPEFAFDEGEGDRTLKYWRAVHWKYFTREAADNGILFDDLSLIRCERFRLMFPKK